MGENIYRDIQPGRFLRLVNSTKIRQVQNVGDRSFIVENYEREDFICCEADPRQCVQEGDLVRILFPGNMEYSLQEVKVIVRDMIITSHQTMSMKQFIGTTFGHGLDKKPFCTEIWAKAGDDDVMHRLWKHG